MLQIDSFEELNETLLELKRSKEREARLAEENQVILTSLTAFSNAPNKHRIFDELKKVLSRYINFTDFVVISKGKYESHFSTFLSSNPQMDGRIWPCGNKFQRVLQGDSILLYEPGIIEEFKSLPTEIINNIRNVLITGVRAQSNDSILLILGDRKGQFAVESKATLIRFRPLLERAISDIENKEKLQKLVEIKTKEVVKAQLTAEQANQAKSKFLAMMSHELRTPLNAVLGIIELLRADSDSYQQELLEKMESSADLLHVIISDILDFSRIESGHFTLHRHWTNLHTKFVPSFDYHKKLATEKGLAFHLKTSIFSNYEYFVDSVRILQIVFNLLGNAIKFTEQGEVSLSISTSQERLNIIVADTGIGIDATTLAQLFTPFIQADNSITRNYGGTGLGLAITKHLVELMDGTIDVSENQGQGTIFSVSLPLVLKKSLDSELMAPKRNPPNETIVSAKKLLLVEDTTTNQMVLKLMLNRMGYNVTIANNGAEALELIRQHDNFDIIFMDISMPVMDGIQATKLLRSRSYSKPIVALTAHSLNEDKQKCLDAGMDDVVMKPIKSKTIQTVINKYLS